MRRMAAVAGGALLAVLFAHATAAAQVKTVRGTVSATASDAVTVKVGDRDMTFKVDEKTKVTARGGTTAMREARAEGKLGVKYTEIVKTGQTVEIQYHDPDMHAASIRVIPGKSSSAAPKAAGSGAAPAGPAPAGTAPKTMTATGVVTAVTPTSLTVKGSGGELTFDIDSKTKVLGPKMGRQAEAMKKAGEKTVISEFVHSGDTVRVRYKDMDGKKQASEVHVTRKSTT